MPMSTLSDDIDVDIAVDNDNDTGDNPNENDSNCRGLSVSSTQKKKKRKRPHQRGGGGDNHNKAWKPQPKGKVMKRKQKCCHFLVVKPLQAILLLSLSFVSAMLLELMHLEFVAVPLHEQQERHRQMKLLWTLVLGGGGDDADNNKNKNFASTRTRARISPRASTSQVDTTNNDNKNNTGETIPVTNVKLITPQDMHRLVSKAAAPNRTHINQQWVIFYHIYVPPTTSTARSNSTTTTKEGAESPEKAMKRQIALDIIREQVDQVRQSYAVRGEQDDDGNKTRRFTTTLLFYTVIGGPLDVDWMSDLCKHGSRSRSHNATTTAIVEDETPLLECHCLGQYDAGHEMKTLDQIPSYCAHHPKQKLIYIHTKGSFHLDSSGPGFQGQNVWRRHMTAAATSRECLQGLSSTATNHENSSSWCNVCGLLFSPLPAEHFAGNSWVGTCFYLQDVLPSTVLSARRAKLYQTMPLTTNYFPYAPPYLGTERYFGEHWVGTSPKLAPCDLSPHPNIGYWLAGDRNITAEFHWALAPRFGPMDRRWAWYSAVLNPGIVDKPYKRMREYYLLPGHLHRWIVEYNETPAITTESPMTRTGPVPEESWVWNWFVDGHRWKKRVQEYGLHAVTQFLATG